MDEATGTAAAAIVAALSELPLAERLQVWRALGQDLFDALSDPAGPVFGIEALDTPVRVDDEDVDQCFEQRRVLCEAAKTARTVGRVADAVVHASAAAHLQIMRIENNAIFEHDPRIEARGFDADEFACDEFGAAIGMRSSSAQTMAQNAQDLCHLPPRLWSRCGQGVARVSSCISVLVETDHLDGDDRLHVEDLIIRSDQHLGSVSAVRRRVRKLLAHLNKARATDVELAQSEVGVWFDENPFTSTLTDLNVTLNADQAWLVKTVIDEHAHTLLEQHREAHSPNPHESGMAESGRSPGATTGAGPWSIPLSGYALFAEENYSPDAWQYTLRQARVDALIDLILGNVRIAPVVDLHVPATMRPVNAASLQTTCSPSRGSLRNLSTSAPSEAVPETVSSLGAMSHSWVTSGVQAVSDRGDCANTSIFGDVHIPRIGLVAGEHIEYLVGLVGASISVAIDDISLENPASGTTRWTATTTYKPTARIRRFVQTRDQHCRFPGCMRKANTCDLDHVIPYNSGGETTPANLQALCRHHHRAKTHGGWGVAMTPEGVCLWQSPLGYWYRTYPNNSVAEQITVEDGLAITPHMTTEFKASATHEMQAA